MAISNSNTFDAAIAKAQRFNFYKGSLGTKSAGSFTSLWKSTGFPNAGNNPGSAAGGIPDRTTLGAIPFTSPGADTLYLSRLGLTKAQTGVVFVGDRVWHDSTLNGTLTTAQTINSPALTRNTSGVGLQLWVEVYTALGATAATLTVSYTNSSGVSGRTGTASIVATAIASQMFPITLQAGDSGVQSVQSATLSVSTGTAGDFGLTLINPLGMARVSAANLGDPPQGAYDTGMPIVDSNACLFFYELSGANSTGILLGDLALAQG